MGLMPLRLLKSAPLRHVRARSRMASKAVRIASSPFLWVRAVDHLIQSHAGCMCAENTASHSPHDSLDDRALVSWHARASADKISNASSQPQSSTPFASSRDSNNSVGNRGPSCAATSSSHNCLSSSSPGRRGSQASPSHAARKHAATALPTVALAGALAAATGSSVAARPSATALRSPKQRN